MTHMFSSQIGELEVIHLFDDSPKLDFARFEDAGAGFDLPDAFSQCDPFGAIEYFLQKLLREIEDHRYHYKAFLWRSASARPLDLWPDSH